MKNSLNDLGNYLFECIERVQDESLTDEELDKEIKRAKSVTEAAAQIQEIAAIQLKHAKMVLEYGNSSDISIPLLGTQKKAE